MNKRQKDETKKYTIKERFNRLSSNIKISLTVVLIALVSLAFLGIAISAYKNQYVVEQVPITYSTQEVEDETAVVGQKKIVTEGLQGIKEITYSQKKLFGLTLSKDIVNTKTVKEPTSEVVKSGIIQITQEKQTESVPFESSTQQGGSGLTKVTQQGAAGTRTIIYEVQMLRGKEISRKLVSNSITKQPISQITTIGKTSCIDVTSYDYNWNNDMLCTRPDGSKFYTNYAGAAAAER